MSKALIGLALLSSTLVKAETHAFDLHVGQKNVQLSPGLSMSKTVVNGMFPGPLIRVPFNSSLEINVHDDLQYNKSTIHWHGMHQIGTPHYDGFPQQSQCPIPIGSSMEYKFQAYPAGSSFYHAHYFEESTDGVYGALVVEDEPGTFPYPYDEEYVIMLSDAYNLTSWEVDEIVSDLGGDTPPDQRVEDPEPSQGFLCVYDESKSPAKPSCSSTTDGRGFNLNFKPGKTYRLRLVCSGGIAPFLFSIDGHEMQVVSVDFSVTDGSAWVKGVPMMTGQRYDVLVRALDNVTDGTKYWVRGNLQNNCGEFGWENLNTDVRGTVTYGKSSVTSLLPQSSAWDIPFSNCSDLDYATLSPPQAKRTVEEPSSMMFLNFTFPSIVDNMPVVLVNGNQYNVSDDAYPTLFAVQENPAWVPTVPGEQRNLLTIPDTLRGKQVRMVLRSDPARDGGGHPFHAHGRGFKVLTVGHTTFTDDVLDNITEDQVLNAITRDTVVVPRSGYVVTQFDVINPGIWAFHCHIGWHLGHGMLGQIIELPNAIAAEISIPQELKDMCSK